MEMAFLWSLYSLAGVIYIHKVWGIFRRRRCAVLAAAACMRAACVYFMRVFVCSGSRFVASEQALLGAAGRKVLLDASFEDRLINWAHPLHLRCSAVARLGVRTAFVSQPFEQTRCDSQSGCKFSAVSSCWPRRRGSGSIVQGGIAPHPAAMTHRVAVSRIRHFARCVRPICQRQP